MHKLKLGLMVPTLLLAGCGAMTQDECVSKFKVYSAGTQRAIRFGYGACAAKIEGKSFVADHYKTQCILDGIGDVKTDQGLRLLAQSCR